MSPDETPKLITIRMSVSDGEYTLIAAMGRNRVIGHAGQLPWRLPLDMAHFRSQTTGHIVIMGRKTFESLGSQPLASRRNIVLSRHLKPGTDESTNVLVIPHHHMLGYVYQQVIKLNPDEKLFVIGGAEIYRLMLPYAGEILLTEVDAEPEGDAFFPELDPQQWQEVSRVNFEADERHDHAFDIVTYQRIKPARPL